MGKRALAAGESGIWKTITKCNPPPPAYDAQMIAIASASVCIDAIEIPQSGLISSIIHELRDLVRQGLRVSTSEDWTRYWDGSKSVEFARLTAALSAAIDAAFASERERRGVIEQSNAICVKRINSSLAHTSKAREIDAAEERIRAACDIVESHRDIADPRLRSVDADCSSLIAGSVCWYSIAMNSLTMATEENVSSSLAEFLVSEAVCFSQAALRAANYADALRSVAPEHHVVLRASIEAASDGWGVVGEIDELQLETSSETSREMRSLLVRAVQGFFKAERIRGSLPEALSALQVSGVPPEILVSLYVKEAGDTSLTSVVKVSL